MAPRRAVNGDAVAVTGGASALDMLVGAGALLAIGRAGESCKGATWARGRVASGALAV